MTIGDAGCAACFLKAIPTAQADAVKVEAEGTYLDGDSKPYHGSARHAAVVCEPMDDSLMVIKPE